MLAHAQAGAVRTGVAVPLVQADVCEMPFLDRSFDIAFSAFGAIPFVADSAAAMREVPEAIVTLVTPEREPLWIFGDAAGAALRELLESRGIALRTGTRTVHVTDDVLWFDSGTAMIADRISRILLVMFTPRRRTRLEGRRRKAPVKPRRVSFVRMNCRPFMQMSCPHRCQQLIGESPRELCEMSKHHADSRSVLKYRSSFIFAIFVGS